MRPLRMLPLAGVLAVACQAPPSQDDGLRPVRDADLDTLARAAPEARSELALTQATVSSPDSRVLAACVAFPQGDGAVLLVLYVTELSDDGQLALRGRYQVREADTGAPWTYVQPGFELEARPAGSLWGELFQGGRMVLEFRALP
ncbi:MAG: hypothetical protein EYC70_09125 [Planctomycetota bacterium]|nr:MAG: hypothetical protein EYC70_09125 [Planctomycetota bacterium]